MQKVLVVIDMQNDFVDGALGSSQAQLIVDNVRKKIESFDGPIIFTRDTHDRDYLEHQEESFYQCLTALKIPRAGILWMA